MDYYSDTYEPMDIDLSAQSLEDMDISYGDSPDVVQIYSKSEAADISTGTNALNIAPDTNTPVIKKYHIVKEKPVRNDINLHLKILSAVLVLLLSIVTYQIHNIKCNDDFNITRFSETLSCNVFGQSKAVITIIEVLKLKERSKILFFYGGTGVGKTLISSLLLDTAGSSSNVYHYTMPSFTDIFSPDVMLGLTFCQSSMIIVDDLTAGDMHIVNQINEVITKAEDLKRNITVILIFNCHDSTKELFQNCDESFDTRLLGKFSGIRAHRSFVKFEPLTEKELKQCIEREVGNRKLNDSEISEIMPQFNVTVDGCKGVHSKMKYHNVI